MTLDAKRCLVRKHRSKFGTALLCDLLQLERSSFYYAAFVVYCAPRTGRKKWFGEWGSIDQQHPWKTEDGPPAPSFGFPSWG